MATAAATDTGFEPPPWGESKLHRTPTIRGVGLAYTKHGLENPAGRDP